MGILYSKLKVFHFKKKLDSLPREVPGILAPIHVRVKPTNICNHNCWYCGYRQDNIQLGKDMVKRDEIPREKMLEIVEDFIEMGVKAVTFSGGGEPLIYPHLLETTRALAKGGVKFAALTNGARLEGELAEVFARHGSWIRVSMDGWDASSYAAYRGVSEKEFERVMGNLNNFKKLGGRCYLGIILIVDGKNAPHVYEMIKRLGDIGVHSVKVSPCIVSNDGVENNESHKPHRELVNEQVQRAVREFQGKPVEIFNSYNDQLGTFEKEYDWCPYIQINPVIGADLNIYSCHDKAYNLDEGLIASIKDRRFKKAWFSDKSQFFKIQPRLRCRHHCVVNAKNRMILEYLNLDRDHLEFV